MGTLAMCFSFNRAQVSDIVFEWSMIMILTNDKRNLFTKALSICVKVGLGSQKSDSIWKKCSNYQILSNEKQFICDLSQVYCIWFILKFFFIRKTNIGLKDIQFE